MKFIRQWILFNQKNIFLYSVRKMPFSVPADGAENAFFRTPCGKNICFPHARAEKWIFCTGMRKIEISARPCGKIEFSAQPAGTENIFRTCYKKKHRTQLVRNALFPLVRENTLVCKNRERIQFFELVT